MAIKKAVDISDRRVGRGKKEEGRGQLANQPNSVCKMHILGTGTVLTSKPGIKSSSDIFPQNSLPSENAN